MVNKRQSVFVILILLVLSSAIIYFNPGSVSAAEVLQVPSESFPTIQSALDAATDNAVIDVAAGTYNENIYAVNSSKQLYWRPLNGVIIQGSKSTVINGDVTIHGFNELKMDGFVITGKLTIGSTADATITNSSFSNLQVSKVTTMMAVNSKLSNSVLNGLKLAGATAYGYSSTGIVVESNRIYGGIDTGSLVQTKIVNNIITDAQVGINDNYAPYTRYGSGANAIFNNTLSGCNIGISLYSSSYYHGPDNVSQNTIKSNFVGIEVSGTGDLPVGNIIYSNQFIANSIQVKINGNFTDIWNLADPPKGNYWSDYTGIDSNCDGIGDQPYIIDSNNQDNYPVMNPFSVTGTSVMPEPSTTAPASASTSPPSTMPAEQSASTTNPQSSLSPSPSPDFTSTPSDQTSQQSTAQAPAIPEINPLFALAILFIAVPVLLKKKQLL